MKTSWNKDQLIEAVKSSTSVRQVICKLGLVEAGGNYQQVKKYIKFYSLDVKHFKGHAWNKGRKLIGNPKKTLAQLLAKNVSIQSYKLKNRLFVEGVKKPVCELCGWSKMTIDGRIPVELDHINGDNTDNRIENLRILCPNCHSLQLTHRGKNKKVQWRNRYTRST